MSEQGIGMECSTEGCDVTAEFKTTETQTARELAEEADWVFEPPYEDCLCPEHS